MFLQVAKWTTPQPDNAGRLKKISSLNEAKVCLWAGTNSNLVKTVQVSEVPFASLATVLFDLLVLTSV